MALFRIDASAMRASAEPLPQTARMIKFLDPDILSKVEDGVGSALAVLFEEAATRAVQVHDTGGPKGEPLVSLAQDALILAAALAVVRARFGPT